MSQEEQVTSLDADLRALRQSKYSSEKVQQVKEWIYVSVLQESAPPPPSEDLMELLKDGVVLCKVANTIEPSAVKYKDSKIPFVQMENIHSFIQFTKHIGVPEDETFQTVDLYEQQDPASVLQAIISFSRYVNEKYPQFPVIGPRLSKKQPPTVPKKPKFLGSQWSSVEYGYMKGANQSSQGVVFGTKRNITSHLPQDQ